MKRLTYILPLMYLFVILQSLLVSPVFAQEQTDSDSRTTYGISPDYQTVEAAIYLMIADDDDDLKNKRKLHLLIPKRIRKSIVVYQNTYVLCADTLYSPSISLFYSDASPPLFV